MRKAWMLRVKRFRRFRRCCYCQYIGGGWPDSGECPSCGEVN